MTKKIGNKIIIEETKPSNCSSCTKIKELRPYGKGGSWVCFDCAMKDEGEMKKQFSKLFDNSRDI